MGFKFNPFTSNFDLSGASAAGAVSNPSLTSTDNAIARFDGTTGTQIQNSSATLDDSGNLTATSFIGDGTSLTGVEKTANKAQANGYASLDSAGKVPVGQLPASVMEFQGTWNATTNSPTLADGTGNTGDVYLVSVGGTQNLGSGSLVFVVKDWVTYDGSIWQRVHGGADVVQSVNGANGAVTVNAISQLTGDVTAGPASGSASAAATVALVGGSSAANVHAAELLANAATDANTVSTIVKRDGSGNFTAGTVTVGQLIDSGLTATTVPYVNASKQLTSSSVTPTELGYMSGVTSAIQTQLDGMAKLTGRTGSQVLQGGTASGETLTLQSTSNATKGKIFFGANSVYDEVNDRLGIRNTSPAYLAVFHNTTDDTFLGSATFIGQTINDSNTWSLYTGNNGTTGYYNKSLNGSVWSANNQGKLAVGNAAIGHPDAQFLVQTRNTAYDSISVKKLTSQASCAYSLYDTDEVTKLWCVNIDGSVTSASLTASTALVSDSSKKIVSSAVTSTELGYVSGVTSAIQTQINGKLTKSAGDIAETSFTAADNQSAAANVTGLAFANATVRSFDALVSVVRSSTYALYKLIGVQGASSWYLDQTRTGDDTGLVFTITTAGQVQYTSTSTGSTATVKFRALTTSV